jgi:signal transduction histidine kinase
LSIIAIKYILNKNTLIKNIRFYNRFHDLIRTIDISLLFIGIIGTIAIIFAIRSIVKPIKQLSKASKEVAKGNFDIYLYEKGDDEISQLCHDFNFMAKELKSIETLHKDFVSNVSHEFKTPITSIKGYASLIKKGNISIDQINEYSDIIIEESERLSLLSTNLLKLSELDSNIVTEHSTKFKLDEQIRKSVLILEPLWFKKNISFDLELETVEITSDKDLLQEVWINLMQNAIKFSNPQGIIKIKLNKNDEMIKVCIEDYGAGIADSDKGRIFERFYKGDKSHSKEGNGLGLVIVKKIVELLSGKIYFESKEGKGTVFIVEFKC